MNYTIEKPFGQDSISKDKGVVMGTQKRKNYHNTKRGTTRHFTSRERRKRQLIKRAMIFLGIGFVCLLMILLFCKKIVRRKAVDDVTGICTAQVKGSPDLDVELLEPNEYSRPQIPLEQVKGVVIHYTANPGSSAMANRNYFDGLKDVKSTKASSHFIVGTDGEIIQCVPCNEVAYASNSRNSDTISIECCHPDETGEFTTATYDSVINLTAWLCACYGLDGQDVIRHYDVTGKECPKYFVDHPDAWDKFRQDVDTKMKDWVKE